jgi:tetratricopeptide (TPR) repeat protein
MAALRRPETMKIGGASSATCRGCAAFSIRPMSKPRNLGRLRYISRVGMGKAISFSGLNGVALTGAFFLCLGLISPALRAQALPELAPLAIEQFDPVIREQVRKAYDEAHDKPRDAEANGRLGMVFHTYEQYELAAACYERARSLAPADFRWLYYWAVVQTALGKQTEATEALKEAARLRPDYLPAQIRLADLLLAVGRTGESRRIYEAALQKGSGLVFAHYGLGRIKASERDLAKAVEHFRQACQLSPHYGAAHYALALAYRDLGQADRANQHFALHQKDRYTRPAQDDPLMDAVAELNAGAFERLKKAANFEAEGNLEQAAAEYESALKINARLAQAQVNLISVYARLGQIEKAEKRYRLAIEVSPDLAEAHYNFGVLLTEQGKYKEAASAFQRSLEINPFDADSHHNYSVLLEREGRLAEATEHYRAALASRPNFRMASFNLGRLLVHQGKNDEAIKHFLNTLTPEDESTPRFMYALAAAYARTGDRDAAIRYARGARERALARGQTELLALIERDLRILEQSK